MPVQCGWGCDPADGALNGCIGPCGEAYPRTSRLRRLAVLPPAGAPCLAAAALPLCRRSRRACSGSVLSSLLRLRLGPCLPRCLLRVRGRAARLGAPAGCTSSPSASSTHCRQTHSPSGMPSRRAHQVWQPLSQPAVHMHLIIQRTSEASLVCSLFALQDPEGVPAAGITVTGGQHMHTTLHAVWSRGDKCCHAPMDGRNTHGRR